MILNFPKYMDNIVKAFSFSKSLGIRYFLHFLYLYSILPLLMNLLPAYAFLYRRYRDFNFRLKLNAKFRYWMLQKEKVLQECGKGYVSHIDDFGLTRETKERITKSLENADELVIGDIDQDGLIRFFFGRMEGVAAVSGEDFLPKERYELKLIAVRDIIAVKKCFKGDKSSFINELSALYHLNVAGANVPAILDIDFENLSITISFINGLNLEELLYQNGARIRDRDYINDVHLASLSTEDGWNWYIQEGRKALTNSIDSSFINDLYAEIQRSHRAGIELYDIKYDKVIVEAANDRPFMVDFDSTLDYSGTGEKTFSVMRDRDTEKFNLLFGSKKLTFKRFKYMLKNSKFPHSHKLYSPVYFGYGLKMGNLLDVNAGFGRWHFILKKHLLPLTGKRILSLGANNGFNEIQMLKYGAKEVVGVEISNEYIEQGSFIKEAFEWADNRSYNFTYLPADMASLPQHQLGSFDLVIALCSIYYLDDLSIEKLVQHLGTITDKIVFQCNIRKDIGRENKHEYTKASVEYNINVLQNSGFQHIRTIAPPKYSRPLVIGQKVQ